MENRKMFWLSLILIILMQIVVIFSDAVYQWEFILFAFLAIFIFVIVFMLLCFYKYKNTITHFKKCDYDYVLKTKFIFSLGDSVISNGYYYMKAISYLEKCDYSNFFLYINKIHHVKFELTKCYLNVIYYHIINDDDKICEAKKKYDELSQNSENPKKGEYDKILILLEQNEFSDEERKYIDQIPFNSIKKLIYNRAKL